MPFRRSYQRVSTALPQNLLAPLLQHTFLILREGPALATEDIFQIWNPRPCLVVPGLFPPAKMRRSFRKNTGGLSLETI